MNRLTIRNSDGAWDVPLRNDDGAYIPSQEIIDRLAAYEETGLEPEEVRGIKTAYDEVQIPYEIVATGADAARVIRLLDAEDEGRLVVLPCKVGDELWITRNGKIQCETVDRITVDQTDEDDDLFISIYTMSVSVLSEDIGRLVFLSREDAEKALEGMDNDER